MQQTSVNCRTGSGRAAPSRGSVSVAPVECHPINSLTPYYQNKWTIRARVTKKMDQKRYNNSRGEGKLFSVELLDETGEIRATAFNQEVDRFFHLLQEDNTYYISGGTVKLANKNFSSMKNDYELSFNSNTEITPCTDAVGAHNIPKMSFSFTPIDQLPNCPKNTVTDVIGVVKSIEGVQELRSKKGEELRKRDLTLLDATKSSIQLTLWGKEAESFEGTEGDVVAVKGCRVGDFGGVSLSTTQSARVFVNPDTVLAHRLKGWFDLSGCHFSAKSLTIARPSLSLGDSAKLIEVATMMGPGADSAAKASYFSVRGTVTGCKYKDCLYQACPSADCKKKMRMAGAGLYHCDKCGKDFERFKYGFILQIHIADFTGCQYVTLFEDQGKKLLGRDADGLGDLSETNPAAFRALFEAIRFKKFLFRIGARTELFNYESRVKWRCLDVQPLNYDRQIRDLDAQIRQMELMTGPVAYY